MDQDELKSIVQDILELDLNNDWEVIDVSACSIYKWFPYINFTWRVQGTVLGSEMV